MENKIDIETAAYHEAGHALMNLAQGFMVREVVVNPNGTGYCRSLEKVVNYNILSEINRQSSYEQLYFLSTVISEVRILLAGPIAEETLVNVGRHTNFYGGDHDQEMISEILSNPVIEMLFDRYAQGIMHVREVLNNEVREWAKEPDVLRNIQVVAENLMIKRVLETDELLDLITSNYHIKIRKFDYG